MAEAHGKLTGRPGIAFVTRGPGASNAAIGIHTAAQDSTPMIVFVGQVGGDFVDREAFQEIDYRRMYGSVAKWAAQIDRAERIPEYVARAFAWRCPAGRDLSCSRCPRTCWRRARMRGRVAGGSCRRRARRRNRGGAHAARRRRAAAGARGRQPLGCRACAALRRFAEANELPVACAFRNRIFSTTAIPTTRATSASA